MYLQHFGLKEYPFNITPDTSFYYVTYSLQEALNTLLVAVSTGEGFVKITGEVGTGKSLLCRCFLKTLEVNANYKLAFIPNPYLDPRGLLMMIGTELGVRFKPDFSHHDLIAALQKKLLDYANKSIRVVVCLDEAQAMPLETVEALRLLSNIETEKSKLIQVVMFGQPELEERLNHPSIRQLRQRISFEYSLKGIQWKELSYYINHRLQVAGYTGHMLFTPPALSLLYGFANGVPRLVNILANKALLSAYGRGKKQVNLQDVKFAILDTQVSVQAQRPWMKRGFKWWLNLRVVYSAIFST